MVGYLVRLLRAVTKATSKWTQNTQAAAKQGWLAVTGAEIKTFSACSEFPPDGLIAEQFCYKLCLILSNISVFCEAELKGQVRKLNLYAFLSMGLCLMDELCPCSDSRGTD